MNCRGDLNENCEIGFPGKRRETFGLAHVLAAAQDAAPAASLDVVAEVASCGRPADDATVSCLDRHGPADDSSHQ
jgi:hypothetical protein